MDLVSKHHELSSFRCYTIEGAMEFFGTDDIADTPTKNRPNYAFMTIEEHKHKYFQETFDNFINEYVLGNDDTDQSEPGDPGAHADHASGTLDADQSEPGVEGAHTTSGITAEMFFNIFLCWRTIGMPLKKGMVKEWPKSIKIFFFISKQTGHSMHMLLK